MITPIILFIDIIYFQRINIFYNSLIILLLPLIYRYILHSLHAFYVNLITKINDVLVIKIIQTTNNIETHFYIPDEPIHFMLQETTLSRMGIRKTPYAFNISLSTAYIKKHPNIDTKQIFSLYYHDMLSICSELYEVLSTYAIFNKKYSFYINFFTLVLMSFCWTYILITGHMQLSEQFLNFFINIQNFI